MAAAMSDGSLSRAPAHIPPGEYSAIYLFHETAFFRKTPKVYVHFKIEGGEHSGVRLYRAYRVKTLKGKPKKFGGFEVNHSHAIYRQMVTIGGYDTRPDRISLTCLKGCLLRISVRTVKRDAGADSRKPRALPDALRYSVVDELVALEAGSLKEAS